MEKQHKSDRKQQAICQSQIIKRQFTTELNDVRRRANLSRENLGNATGKQTGLIVAQQNIKVQFKTNRNDMDTFVRSSSVASSSLELESLKRQGSTIDQVQDLRKKYLNNIINVESLERNRTSSNKVDHLRLLSNKKNPNQSRLMGNQCASSIESIENAYNMKPSKYGIPITAQKDFMNITPVLNGKSSHSYIKSNNLGNYSNFQNDGIPTPTSIDTAKNKIKAQQLSYILQNDSLQLTQINQPNESSHVEQSLYQLTQSVNTQAEGGDKDDEYLLKQSMSTTNVRSNSTNGPKIAQKKSQQSSKRNNQDDKSSNILHKIVNTKNGANTVNEGIHFNSKLEQQNANKFKIPVNDSRNRANVLASTTNVKNKSFEKVSISDLRQNLSRLRSKKRNLNDGSSIQKIMNETMDNYKTNLKLKQNTSDELNLVELQTVKLQKKSAKSLALNKLLSNNASERFKNLQKQGQLVTDSSDTTHLPNINIKFKAYEDNQQNLKNLLDLQSRQQNGEQLKSIKLKNHLVNSSKQKSAADDDTHLKMMQSSSSEIEKTNKNLRKEIHRKKKLLDKSQQPSQLYGVILQNKQSTINIKKPLLDQQNYHSLSSQNFDMGLSPDETNWKSQFKTYEPVQNGKQTLDAKQQSKNYKEMNDILQFTQDIMDTNERNAAKMNLNDQILANGSRNGHGLKQLSLNESKAVNTRSQTQIVQYQTINQSALDKDKIMSKAYLGRTHQKNVMQTQKLQPLKLTQNIQKIQDSVGHILHSKRTSNNLSTLNMRKLSDQNHEKRVSSSGLNITFREDSAPKFPNNLPAGNIVDSTAAFNLTKLSRKSESKTDSKVAQITKVYNNSNHHRLQNSNESLISVNQLKQFDSNSESTNNQDIYEYENVPQQQINFKDQGKNTQAMYKQIQHQANSMINSKGQSILKKNLKLNPSERLSNQVNQSISPEDQWSQKYENAQSQNSLQKMTPKVKIQVDGQSKVSNEEDLNAKRRSITLEPPVKIIQHVKVTQPENLNKTLDKSLNHVSQDDLQVQLDHKATLKKSLIGDQKRKRKIENPIIKKVESGKLDRYDIIKNAYDREAKLKILNINLMSKEEIQKFAEKRKGPQIKSPRRSKAQDLQRKLKEMEDQYKREDATAKAQFNQSRLLDKMKSSKGMSRQHEEAYSDKKRYDVKQIYGHNHGHATIEEERIKENGKFITKLKIDPTMHNKVVKCYKCHRMKLRLPHVKVRKIDATPLKYRGLGRMQALSESKSNHYIKPEDNISHGYETGSSVNKAFLSPMKDSSPVKRLDQARGSYNSVGRSPNLLRFLQTDKSKTRNLLAKAYNLKLENELEFQQKHDPSTKFIQFKNQFDNQKVQTARDHYSEQAGLSKTHLHHSYSPKTSRRRINALIPSLNKKRYQFKENKYESPEKTEQRLLKQMQKNTPAQNFYLYQQNEKARKLFHKFGEMCDCDQKMIHEKSMNTSVGSFNRRYKVGNSVIESQAEYLDDVKSLAALTMKGSHVMGPRGRASYVPCRRTCSTIHNPMFHRGRHDTFYQKPVKPRVQSADNNKKKDYSYLDWGNTQMQQMVDVARINKSIALQKVNNEQLDNLDIQSMVDEQPSTIQFAPLGKGAAKKSIDSKTKSKKKPGTNMTIGQQKIASKTAEKGKKPTSLTENRGRKRSKSRGHFQDENKDASPTRRNAGRGGFASRARSDKKTKLRKGSRDVVDDSSDDSERRDDSASSFALRGDNRQGRMQKGSRNQKNSKSAKRGEALGSRAGKSQKDKTTGKRSSSQAAKDQAKRSKGQKRKGRRDGPGAADYSDGVDTEEHDDGRADQDSDSNEGSDESRDSAQDSDGGRDDPARPARSPKNKESKQKKQKGSKNASKRDKKQKETALKQKGYTISNEDQYGDLINIKINTHKSIGSSSDSGEDGVDNELDVNDGPIGRQLNQATQLPRGESLAILRLRQLGLAPSTAMVESPDNAEQSPERRGLDDGTLRGSARDQSQLELQRVDSEQVYGNLTAENLQQFSIGAPESTFDKREIYGTLGQGGLGGVDGLGQRGDRDLKKILTKKQRKRYERQKQLELNDLKFLFRNIDYEMQQKCKEPTFSNQECTHLYSMVKEPSLVDQNLFAGEKLDTMVETALRTLKILMESLILKQEHRVLAQAYKQKLDFEAQKITKTAQRHEIQIEQLKKILVRCKRCYEAKYSLVRILVKAKKREYLLNLMDETMEKSMTDATAKQYYFTLLKISCKIYNMVQMLRIDHPMLNRPFIYQGVNLQTHMIKQILNVRENLHKKYDTLRQNKELDRVLDKTGKIILVSELSLLNQELAEKKGAMNALLGLFRDAKNKVQARARDHQMRQVLIGQIRAQKDSSMSATF